VDIFAFAARELMARPLGFVTIYEALFALGMRQLVHGNKWPVFIELFGTATATKE